MDPFKSAASRGTISYYRIHGITGHWHRFTDDDLGTLRTLAASQRDVYCLFNNASMLEDARRFIKGNGGP